ncbi:MAG: flagellar basal-body MS-ring/collar protein FliF [Alphaproteobacteria bacterium]
MSGITRSLQGINPARLMLLVGMLAIVAGLLFFIATRLVQPSMSLLYGDLYPGDSSKIVTKLEGMAVPYDLRAGGSQVFVPGDRVLRLRMSMAEEGLPRGGSIGYEVFDRSDILGATRSIQNINLLRALEGELARTIGSLSQIAGARVHLVLPKRELFNRSREEPSASIVITEERGTRLNQAQVTAIQHLVAAAVPGLEPARVSIVDSHGTLRARGTDGDDDGGLAPLAAQDHRVAFESRLKKMIEGLIERSVGAGNVRAEVSAEIDFDRITTSAEIFDPDSQVARSVQIIEEESNSSENAQSQNVSVANSLPDAGSGESTGSRNVNATARVEEITNFEISKTIRSHVRESGTVKRLSVAVLVDGNYTTNGDGEKVYEPRSPEEMKQFVALVRSAIGFDEARGDTIEIVNLQFAAVDAIEPGEAPMFDLAKGDYFKMAEIVVLFVVGILVILLVLRPIATQVLASPAQSSGFGGGEARAALPGTAQPAQLPPGSEGEEGDDGMDIDRIEGRVKQSTLKKVGEIVETHPEEALSIVRNWLYQEV